MKESRDRISRERETKRKRQRDAEKDAITSKVRTHFYLKIVTFTTSGITLQYKEKSIQMHLALSIIPEDHLITRPESAI